MVVMKGRCIQMITCKLPEFVVKNIERTATMAEQKNVLSALNAITMLTPREIGHLLFIFASAERASRRSVNAITHFKHLSRTLTDIKFEMECAQCF